MKCDLPARIMWNKHIFQLLLSQFTSCWSQKKTNRLDILNHLGNIIPILLFFRKRKAKTFSPGKDRLCVNYSRLNCVDKHQNISTIYLMIFYLCSSQNHLHTTLINHHKLFDTKKKVSLGVSWKKNLTPDKSINLRRSRG